MLPCIILFSYSSKFPEYINSDIKLNYTKNISDFKCAYYFVHYKEINREKIKEILNKLRIKGYDAIFVPKLLDSSIPSLFAFDMDSTLIEQEVIDEIAREIGIYNQISEITKQAMNGDIDFKESFRKRVFLLKGCKVDVLEKVYSRITLNTGVKIFFDSVKKYLSKVVVISGGFYGIVERFCNEFGVDDFACNNVEIKNGKFTGKVIGEVLDSYKKAEYLQKFIKKYSIDFDQVIAVGDGFNDVEMLISANIGIGFRPKKSLEDLLVNYLKIFGIDFLFGLFG